MKDRIKKGLLKALPRVLLFGAAAGLFAGLMIFLSRASQKTETEKMDWQPETAKEYSQDWQLAAENENLELWFQPSSTQLYVRDKKTGALWRSNPENAGEDPIAFGQNKTAVQSLLNVTYVNEESNYYVMNSFQGSVQKNTYTYQYQDDGVFVNWQFGDQGFEIPCFFGIREDRFVARILSDQLQQHDESLKVASISLLPYFGAGSLEDQGYMMVPDGSGALIYFNNQKQSYQSYSQTVYGRDLALNLQNNLLEAESAVMPVFGIRKNENAMLAVITEGEYQSEIKAEVSRKLTANNIVYSNVVFIESENNTLLANSSNEETVVMLSPQQNRFPYYEVSYFFLEQGGGYAEMARCYQSWLEKEQGMERRDAALQKSMNLTFLGGVEVRRTMLGVPYRAVEPLTAFQDLQECALALKEDTAGSFQVSIYQMEKGANKSRIPVKASYSAALGGKSSFAKMTEALEEEGIPVYPVFDPVTMKASGGGYNTLKASRNVSRSVSPQYQYLLTSGSRNTQRDPEYLISPEYVEGIMERLTADFFKKGTGRLGLTGISNKMYSDFRREDVSRIETGEHWENALQKAEDAAEELLLQEGFAYGFPYADVITYVPVFSSGYDVEDEEIPFYQMVMSGYASLYGSPVNLSGNVGQILLRCVEYGVSPTFLLVTTQAQTLLDTDMADYYSVAYEGWEPRIKELLVRLQELNGVWGQRIVGHERISDQVSVTTFEDGSAVYVNYGQESQQVGDVVIPGMDFVKEGV